MSYYLAGICDNCNKVLDEEKIHITQGQILCPECNAKLGHTNSTWLGWFREMSGDFFMGALALLVIIVLMLSRC